MRRSSRFLLLFASVVFLMAPTCPFEATVPLAEPEGSIDPRLAGVWLARGGDGELGVLEFIPFNDAEYLAEWAVREGSKVTRMQFRAYRVAIGEHEFLQLQPLNEEGKYLLGRYVMPDASTLVIRLVQDTIVPDEVSANPQRLRRIIEENITNEKLFGGEEPMVFARYEATPMP
ncbi:MAG TPA: hypothetical protein VGF40_03345 [Thermoanaerobaculia bacterium]